MTGPVVEIEAKQLCGRPAKKKGGRPCKNKAEWRGICRIHSFDPMLRALTTSQSDHREKSQSLETSEAWVADLDRQIVDFKKKLEVIHEIAPWEPREPVSMELMSDYMKAIAEDLVRWVNEEFRKG